MSRRPLLVCMTVALAACGLGVDLGTPSVPTTASTAPASTTTRADAVITTSPATTSTSASPVTSSTAAATSTTTVTDDGGMNPVPASLMSDVLADASARTGVSRDDLVVVTAIAVTWPDGSLGCPEPGMSYTQALVDGYHVVLDADGTTLDYRLTQRGFRLCSSSSASAGDATRLVVPDPPSKGDPIDPILPIDPNL